MAKTIRDIGNLVHGLHVNDGICSYARMLEPWVDKDMIPTTHDEGS